MEYKTNQRYKQFCDKYCVTTSVTINASLESPYSTITFSFNGIDNDTEYAFISAYAIDFDEVVENDLSIFDIFDEFSSEFELLELFELMFFFS